jgi:hypothetical protein
VFPETSPQGIPEAPTENKGLLVAGGAKKYFLKTTRQKDLKLV